MLLRGGRPACHRTGPARLRGHLPAPNMSKVYAAADDPALTKDVESAKTTPQADPPAKLLRDVESAKSAKGGICSYLFEITVLIILSTIGFVPPLFLPIEAPEDGVLANAGPS